MTTSLHINKSMWCELWKLHYHSLYPCICQHSILMSTFMIKGSCFLASILVVIQAWYHLLGCLGGDSSDDIKKSTHHECWITSCLSSPYLQYNELKILWVHFEAVCMSPSRWVESGLHHLVGIASTFILNMETKCKDFLSRVTFLLCP